MQVLEDLLLNGADVDMVGALGERVHFHGILQLLQVVAVQVDGEEDANLEEADHTQANEQTEDATKISCRRCPLHY